MKQKHYWPLYRSNANKQAYQKTKLNSRLRDAPTFHIGPDGKVTIGNIAPQSTTIRLSRDGTKA